MIYKYHQKRFCGQNERKIRAERVWDKEIRMERKIKKKQGKEKDKKIT